MSSGNAKVEFIKQVMLLTAVYIATGYLGLLFVAPPQYGTLIWPPAGIALGVLLICGKRLWIGVGVGAFIFNLAHIFSLSQGVIDFSSVVGAAGIAIGATLQALIGYKLINKYFGSPLVINEIRDVLLMFIFAGPLVCLVSASIGTSTLYFLDKLNADEVYGNWLAWWAGDVFGVIVFLPLMLLALIGNARNFLNTQVVNKLPGLAIFVIILPLGLTFYAWKISSEYIYEKNSSYFNIVTRDAELTLLNRMNAYKQNLVSGAFYFMGQEKINREKWNHYVDTINLDIYNSGINGLGFITKLSKNDLQAFLEDRHREFSTFDIHPISTEQDKFIITYLEPENRNLAAIGFDIFSEERRRVAAVSAMETGETTITKKIALVQDESHGASFLMLHPVYKKPSKYLHSKEERIKNFVGWMYAPFIGGKFIEALPERQSHILGLEVYDGDKKEEGGLIFSTAKSSSYKTDHAPMFERTSTIDVLQQKWTLVWSSTPAFEGAAANREPIIILIGGLIFTTLFGVVISILSQRTQTVQKIVDEKIREISSTEIKMALLINNTPASVAMFDMDMRYIAVSNHWCNEYNLDREDILGTSYSNVFLEILNISDWKNTFERLMSGEVISSDETTWIGKNGKRQWLRYALHPWIDAQGYVGGVVIFTENITKRKETENALKASEQTFRAAMYFASIGKALVDINGHLLKVNPAFCELLGYSEDELMKMDFQKITHPDDLQEDLRHVASLLSGKFKAYQMEKRYIHQSGSIVWVNLSVSLVRNSEGEPIYFVSEINDITQKKEMERLKDEFISIVSHELRTPVTSVNLALNLVSKSLPNNIAEEVVRYVDIAIKNSEKLIYLINDILDLRKISEGEMEYNISKQNICQILKQVVYENQNYGDKYGVAFKFKDIPEEIYVDVDPVRLNQVLANLLSNAAKFSQEGGEVNIEVKKEDKNVRVWVKDSGVGIPKAFYNRIFSKFSQADSSLTRKKEGTGLGLFICKEMVQKMHGRIGFESQVGNGTAFWVEFEESLLT